MTTLGCALALARGGWPVLPVHWTIDGPNCSCRRPGCDRPGKHPLTGHGLKDATVDPDRIRAWWDRWPAANLAVTTGAPGPDVLDVDVRPDGDGWAAYERLRRAGLLAGATARVRTPSGGLHLYYPGSDQGNGSIQAAHVDFRGRGGYVLVPPSVVTTQHYAGGYELLEHRGQGRHLDWQRVRDLLAPRRPQPTALPTGNQPVGLGALARWVADQQPGNRNQGLFWAACRAVEAGYRDLSELVTAAETAGLSRIEAERTAASATRTGVAS